MKIKWQSMTDHKFPWPHKNIIIAAYVEDEPDCIDVHRCNVAEYGAIFFKDGGMLSVIEMGWKPFAWVVDNIPDKDNLDFPAMMNDYITENNK